MTARKIWLAIKSPLTMLVLLAFVVGVSVWAVKAVKEPIPPRPPDACVQTKVGSELTADHVYVRLYNGTSTSGLAKNVVKLQLGNAGFHVWKVANAEGGAVDKTFISGVDPNSPEVLLVRSYFPAGTPVTADPTKYRDHMVDITLGNDFKAANLGVNAKKSVPLPDGTACLPPQSETKAADAAASGG